MKSLLLILLLIVQTVSFANGWFFSGEIGGGIKIGYHEQNYSPVSGMVNLYVPNENQTNLIALYSLSTGYQFNMNDGMLISVALQPGYIAFNKQKGTEKVAININPAFDEVSYAYDMHSYFIMLKGKLSFAKHHWFPYIALGIGKSFNTLKNYQEQPLGSLAPSEHPFGDQTKTNMAYSVEFGLFQSKYYKHFNFSIGYQLISLGRGCLSNATSGQDAITSGDLYGNFLSLSLNFMG